jgi:hypothetical protein
MFRNIGKMVNQVTKAKFNQDHKNVLDSYLLNLSIVEAGKMFGYPAYYVGGKLFACVFEDGIGVKVPEEMANELLKREDIVRFQPLGRKKMREWIQINKIKSEEYLAEKKIFDESIKFVAKIAGIHLTKENK